MKEVFQVFPIGYVRAGENGFSLQIEEAHLPALKALDSFSHLVVLYWFHLLDTPDSRSITQAEQPYRLSPDRLGIFATRSPIRPNPIGLSVTPILRIDQEKGLIQIPYIDAMNGTPILDLKPYHPSSDRVKKVTVPEWCSHWPEWYEDSAGFNWQAEFVNAR